MKKKQVPVTLTIAGSDNSGGAGIQADLKTFTTLGTYGTTAITCVVAEHPGCVRNIHPVPASRVVDQIELIFEAFPVAAAKTGMLYSNEIINRVADFLETRPRIKLVVDPVMVATSGATLLRKNAIRSLCDRLFPLASLVTPNLDEASLILGKKLRTLEDVYEAASLCASRWGVPFLIKGGHLNLPVSTDALHTGKKLYGFGAATIRNVKTHGTGCTYSSAICAHLALGNDLPQAVKKSKTFITRAIREHFKLGRYQALNHLPS